MLAQAVIVKDGNVLMLHEHVQRGDLVWNFPGGGIESGETPEQACILEAAYISPFERAQQTLQCLSQRTDLTIQLDDRLSERVLSGDQRRIGVSAWNEPFQIRICTILEENPVEPLLRES